MEGEWVQMKESRHLAVTNPFFYTVYAMDVGVLVREQTKGLEYDILVIDIVIIKAVGDRNRHCPALVLDSLHKIESRVGQSIFHIFLSILPSKMPEQPCPRTNHQ